MKNIMRAQLYQLVRSKAAWAAILIPLFMLITNVTGELDYAGFTMGKFLAENAYLVYSLAMISSIVMACLISGGDFLDKTANYEILSGHSRSQFFAGRALLSVIVGVVTYTINIVIIMLVGNASAGFGNELQMQELWIRYLLSLLVVMRIVCEFICFTCILQNPLLPMGFGVALCMSSQILIEFMHAPESLALGITSLNRLSQFFSWMSYGMAEGHTMIYSYGLKMQQDDVIGIVISSLGFGIAALILGYSFYKRDDLR